MLSPQPLPLELCQWRSTACGLFVTAMGNASPSSDAELAGFSQMQPRQMSEAGLISDMLQHSNHRNICRIAATVSTTARVKVVAFAFCEQVV